MPRSPLKPLSSAVVLFLLCASPAHAYDFTENHPGFWVEWVQTTNGVAPDFELGDADDDGDLDLFVIDGSTLELWRNNGIGEFDARNESICPLPLSSILWIDADGDSRFDIVGAVAAPSGGIVFMKGLGTGTFGAPVVSNAGKPYADLAVLDHSRLVAAYGYPNKGFDIIGSDHGLFSVQAAHMPDATIHGIAVVDVNNDGMNDVVASGHSGTGEIAVFLGAGSELSLANRFSHLPLSVHIAPIDLDGDGDLDLVTGDDLGVSTFISDGTGHGWIAERQPMDIGSYPPAVFSSDLDQDGHPDLILSRMDGTHGVFLEEYRGVRGIPLTNPRVLSYAHAEEYVLNPSEMRSADVNGDGRLDLLVRSEMLTPPRTWQARPVGMIGVLLTRPDGSLGGTRFHPLVVVASQVASARFAPRQPARVLFASNNSIFMTSLNDGEFGPPVRVSAGSGMKIVDLDHDGRDDLIAMLPDDAIEVRSTNHGGVPKSVTARIGGRLLDVHDLNQDKRPELLLRRADGSVEVHWGHPGNRFERSTRMPFEMQESGYHQVVLADADGDGRSELVELLLHHRSYSSYEPSTPDTIRVYRILPSGRVRDVTTSVLENILPPEVYPSHVKAADLDGLSGEELVVAAGPSGWNGSQLIILAASGNRRYSYGSSCAMGGEGAPPFELGDYDGDGDLDAFAVSNIEGSIGVIHLRWNDGHGRFEGGWARRMAGSRTVGSCAGDFDGDGTSDLAAIVAPRHGGDSKVTFLFGRPRESATVSQAARPSRPNRITSSTLAIHSITPNPAREAFAIDWTARPGEALYIGMHDVMGRRILSEQIATPGISQRVTQFNPPNDLPAGLYWVRLRQGSETATRRVAIVR